MHRAGRAHAVRIIAILFVPPDRRHRVAHPSRLRLRVQLLAKALFERRLRLRERSPEPGREG